MIHSYSISDWLYTSEECSKGHINEENKIEIISFWEDKIKEVKKLITVIEENGWRYATEDFTMTIIGSDGALNSEKRFKIMLDVDNFNIFNINYLLKTYPEVLLYNLCLRLVFYTFEGEPFCVECEYLDNYIKIKFGHSCILPINPFTYKRQFDIWKIHAPKWAKILLNFTKVTNFEFSAENGDKTKYSFISKYPYFAVPTPTFSFEYDDMDEFHIPFELLSEEERRELGTPNSGFDLYA